MFRYNLFLYLISPFILIKLFFYSLKSSVKLQYFSHKIFGTRLSKKYAIWIHAASIGEMKIAIKVAQCLAMNRANLSGSLGNNAGGNNNSDTVSDCGLQ